MALRIGIFLLIASLIASCRKDNFLDCFKSNGADITEVRYPGEFRVVESRNNIEVTIGHGSECKVEVTAGKGIISNIWTHITDGKLIIENVSTCTFVRGYKHKVKVKVTMPHLSKAVNFGVGSLTVEEGFNQDSINVRGENSGDIYLSGAFTIIVSSSHGNGDIYVDGKCKQFYSYCYGTNYLFASGLSVRDYLFVETISIGHCYVNCEGLFLFEYNIWNEGNIYYKSDPYRMTNFSKPDVKGRAIKED